MRPTPQLRFLHLAWSLLVFLILGPLSAQAHDPGLSSATVTVGRERIDVVLGFAKKDAESLVIANGNPAEAESTQGFAVIESRLEALVARAVELR
ncbi:MAG TPA: hypothetical protein VHY59_06020, partial [Chthoniobacterales bacterium]|nr:hypothetical protein [Chthoniobacterales bacterium]